MRMLIASFAVIMFAAPAYADGEPSTTTPSTSNVISTHATKAVTDATAKAAEKGIQKTKPKDHAIKKTDEKKPHEGEK